MAIIVTVHLSDLVPFIVLNYICAKANNFSYICA
jgi:hypothetical protein